jgi:polyisoprenoid-binding protein YceI
MLKNILIAGSAMIAIGTAANAEKYMIDTEGAHASIGFETLHLGYSVLAGRFDTFSGTFDYDSADPSAASVSVTIDTSSVNSNHGARDNHLRSDDFLDVAAHPEASFVSTGVEVTGDKTATITGDLTLRGITKPVVLDAEFVGEGKDPWGGYRAGFKGSTTIQLGDFGMDGMLGNAPVTITLFVEGIKQ